MKNLKRFNNFKLNESIETDPIKVKKLYDQWEDGYYLAKTGGISGTEMRMRPNSLGQTHVEVPVIDFDNGEFIMYDSEDDASLHQYLTDLLGPWTYTGEDDDNTEEYAKYTICYRDKEKDIEEFYTC